MNESKHKGDSMEHSWMHPDLIEKVLLTLNISIFSMIMVIFGLYYNMIGDGVTHQQAINISVMIGLFVGVIIGSVIYAKYLHKHKEKIGKNIQKK